MKRIYYLKKHEVKLGDKIELNGISDVTVTQDLIDANPDLFEVEENEQEDFCGAGSFIPTEDLIWLVPSTANIDVWTKWLYRYPKYTKFNSLYINNLYWKIFAKREDAVKYIEDNSKDPLITTEDGVKLFNGSDIIYLCPSPDNTEHRPWEEWGNIPVSAFFVNNYLCLSRGQWLIFSTPEARQKWLDENYPVLFTTEDGVDIRRTMECYFIDEDDTICQQISFIHDPLRLYFSTKEAAEEYVRKHKEKTLKDYEDMLGDGSLSGRVTYSWLKENEPKLYWLKVLQLIADDLNNNYAGNQKWNIYYDTIDHKYRVGALNYSIYGNVNFKSIDTGEKAIKTMGDKLDYIYQTNKQ